ncbi:chemotaxis protein CheW [Capsulimonas corticalis]|uniref:Chemotaxis protein CheW n=1 Tax=Capsulimonas corticalis TaxID=2219043 RepID=A0A402D6M0_9BACT|nr:chemotaxis protein CheW [Capsulimonas corticalis]BDI30597.1 chemotaxis protein CheW [Capsulimonas corticalis]
MALEQTQFSQNDAGHSTDANQYLTFSLGDEEYGVDILKVQEIKGYVPTTRIPNAPPEVVGVLNLRGTIVPIVDLRRKFGLEEIEYNQFTAIVVVVVQNRVMGVIVDSVSEVVNIPLSDIQPAPDFGNSMNASTLQGMARMGENLIILLDIDIVLLGEPAPLALAA